MCEWMCWGGGCNGSSRSWEEAVTQSVSACPDSPVSFPWVVGWVPDNVANPLM